MYIKFHAISSKFLAMTGKESVIGSNHYFSENMGWCDREHTRISRLLSEPGSQDTICLGEVYRLLSAFGDSDPLYPQDKVHTPQPCLQGSRSWPLHALSSASPAISPSCTLCPKHHFLVSLCLPLPILCGTVFSLHLIPSSISLANSSFFRYVLIHHFSGRPPSPHMLGSRIHLILCAPDSPLSHTALHIHSVGSYMFLYLYPHEIECSVATGDLCYSLDPETST